MRVIRAERCGCGEQHAVEIPGENGERIDYLRLHDLAPIESCEGCGRPFAEVLDELERGFAGDERWNDDPEPLGCGGIRVETAR